MGNFFFGIGFICYLIYKKICLDIGRIFSKLKNKIFRKYNKAFNQGKKIESQILYHKLNNQNSRNLRELDLIEKILFFKNGNILIIKNNSLSIRNADTYRIIKTYSLNYFQHGPMSDVILFSDYEILLIFYDSDKNCFYFVYNKLDNKYKIIDSFYKKYIFFFKDFISKHIKLLKLNKKNNFAMIYNPQDTYEDKNMIYFFYINKEKKDIILKTKIKIYETYFLQVKRKNEYVLNVKRNYASIFNANSLILKKSFKFEYDYADCLHLVNDKYILFKSFLPNSLIIYNIDNFQLIYKYNVSNEIKKIVYIDKNIFFVYEESNLEGLEREYYIKKYLFDEQKRKIICLGNIEINYYICLLFDFGKINDDYYIFFYTDWANFYKKDDFIEMQKIIETPKREYRKVEIITEEQSY